MYTLHKTREQGKNDELFHFFNQIVTSSLGENLDVLIKTMCVCCVNTPHSRNNILCDILRAQSPHFRSMKLDITETCKMERKTFNISK